MIQKESLIKYQEKLREMVPEVIEDLEDDRTFYDIADNLVDGLMEVINEEFAKRSPGALPYSYEVY